MKDIIKSTDTGMCARINSIPKFKIMEASKAKPLSIEVDSCPATAKDHGKWLGHDQITVASAFQ